MKSLIKKNVFFFYAIFNFAKFLIFDLKKIKNAKTIFFFPFYKTGGAEKVHLNIVKALASENVCVIFTLHSATTNFFQEFKENASCIEINPILNKKNSLVNKWLMKSIYETINKSTNCKTVFGCNSVYYYELLPKFVTTIKKNDLFHNFFENDEREASIINSVKYIDNRIVINEAAKNDIIKFYVKNKIDLIYNDRIKIIGNGIKLAEQVFPVKNDAQIKIGFIGRWCFEKRPEVFLRIAREIKKQYNSVSFVMAGTGMKSNLRSITDSGVLFLGEITNEKELEELYKELHLIIQPSIYEGFPMVIMESMSYGVIPISTDLDGIKEHITSNYNGILVDGADEYKMVQSFCESITLLIENPDIRNKLAHNCFTYAHESFGIERFNDCYKKLLS